MTTPTLPSTNALFNQTGPDHEFIAMTTPSLTETTMRESSEFAGELAQLNDRLIPAITKDRDEWKRKAEEAARVLHKIKQILLPDPHDEREVSAEWQVKAIRAAIDAAIRRGD